MNDRRPWKLLVPVAVNLLLGVPAVVPLPKVATQSASVPRAMPKSLAMPDSVAPSVDSYRSTA